MQHTIQLDQQTERHLLAIATNKEKSTDDILMIAVKDFLQQQTKQTELEVFLKPYQINVDGFKFDRELANER